MSTKNMAQSKGRGNYKERINLLLFSSGKLISLFGSAIYTFAVGLYLLKSTGSGLTFATNIVLYTLPMVIFNPLAGVIADKINKKIVVVGSDFLNGLFSLGVYLLSSRIGLSTQLVYISTFVITVLAVFFNIGIESAKPNLVSKEKLLKINSLDRVIESSSYVIGPMAGGLIYSFIDMRLFILINALSFFLAALMEMFINYQYNKKREILKKSDEREPTSRNQNGNIWFNMKEAYQYIFSRKDLQAIVYIFIAINFIFNFSIVVPLPYLLNTFWKVDSRIYGIVQGALPVGMIIGALLIGKVRERLSYSKLLKRITFSNSLMVLFFALPLIIFSGMPGKTFILIYYTTLMIIGGIIISWVDIPASVLLQKIVPDELLGRVISVKLSIVKIIVPIALIISGYLLNIISPLYIFLAGTILFIIFNLCFYSSSIAKSFINYK